MLDSKLVLDSLKGSLANKFGESINDVILFGSQASNTAREDSDYDILIVLNNICNQQLYDSLFDCVFETGLEYNILFDMHVISTPEMNHTLRGADPFFLNAIKNGIHL